MKRLNGASKGIKSVEFLTEESTVKLNCKHGAPMICGSRRIDSSSIPAACLSCIFKHESCNFHKPHLSCDLPRDNFEIKNEHIMIPAKGVYKINSESVESAAYFSRFNDSIYVGDSRFQVSRDFRFATGRLIEFCVDSDSADSANGTTYSVTEECLVDKGISDYDGCAKMPIRGAIAARLITDDLDFEIVVMSYELFCKLGMPEEHLEAEAISPASALHMLNKGPGNKKKTREKQRRNVHAR